MPDGRASSARAARSKWSAPY
jgi:hypothetical protein